MPRRRKKSSHQKPPLIFTESPVNRQRNVPTPVYCAQHPISVPRQSVQDMSWVSPQFNGVPGTTRGQRRARRRRVSHPSLITDKPPCTCHGRSNSKSPRYTKLKKKSKFPSLEFVGESTPPVTVIQDVSFTDSEDDNESIKENSPDKIPEKSNSRRKSSETHRNSNSVLQNSSTNELMVNPGVIKTPELVEANPELFESGSLTPKKRLFNSSQLSQSLNLPVINLRRKMRRGRLKQQLIENLTEKSFICTPEKELHAVEILVTDTPEAEYGLNTRVRRFKRRNINKSVTENIC